MIHSSKDLSLPLRILFSLLSVSALFGVLEIISFPSSKIVLASSREVQPHTILAQRTLQSDPVEDRFPQRSPDPSPLPPEPQQDPPEVEEIPPVPQPEATDTPIPISNIIVTGNTAFGEAEINPLTQPLQGQTVTIDQLRSVTDAITQLYLNAGYITSRAILVEDSLPTGQIDIRVIEGRLERIDVEGTQRVNPDYVRSRIQLGANVPLNSAALEDQLRLLNNDPLFTNVEASLRAGTGLGQSVLAVRVNEADPFGGSVSLDNYSPPSVGAVRAGINLRYLNLTGIGDQISTTYYRTLAGGSDSLDFAYRIPVNPLDGSIQLRTLFNWNEVVAGAFAGFDITGEAQLYELSYRQPLIRTPREEFALSLGFTFQDGQTFLGASPTPFGLGPDPQGVSRTSVFKFGQEYIYREVTGAWAIRSLFSLGTGLFDATVNPDPLPDSRFLSWLGQVQRVQVLNPDNFLIIQADLQLATDSLLPSQQFVMGGGQSVRGYRQNVRAGDNGFRFSIEDRMTLSRSEAGISQLQIAPFFDAGLIWNVADNPNPLQTQQFIAGIGLGVLWQPIQNLNLRLDYGYPLVNLDDRGDNIQDDGLYFRANYLF